nr:reverse transcriptase domain-containing protein [Tanacetum cinerariifolium]
MNPTLKGRIRKSSKQKVENSHFEERLTPVATMTDNRTMAEMLRAPTEGYAEAIIVPPILAEQFELKHSLINMMTSEQFFRLEKDNPHDHVRWFNKITSTIKYKDVPNSVIKLILFPFSLEGVACRWLEKEPPHSITTWDDLVSKFINEFFPPSRTTNLRNEILNFQQKFDESFHEAWERYKDLLHQDSLNAAAGGNLLEKSPQDALTNIENKSKVRNSRSKSIASPVNACDNHSSSELAKLTHAVNQQTSVVTTAMTAMLKQFQSNPPPAQVKAVEEICVTCRGAHPYYQCLVAGGNTFPKYQDNIQGYVSAATGNFNQGNPGYHPQGVANQMRPPESGTLSGNTIANPKGELKAITTRSGLATERPTIPNPPKSVNPEEDECVEDTYTDPNHAEYTIKVPPPPPVQKPKPPIQINFVLYTRDSLPPHIPYPSRILKQKQQEKNDIQIQKFWNMFKQHHLNITLAEALVLMPKYQKMLKALLSNKEKLQELANTPLNESCSAVILKKLPEKLGDPVKFLIPCGFSELKCKALVDLGASINLMPLSVWKKLGLPDLIPTLITLKLANRAIYTPDGIARDVFVLVGKFTFPASFVVVDYERDPRVPLILGRPFLRTARALIDVHGEEMILCDGDERLTLNMKHGTASYSNHPRRESVNLINIFNFSSEDSLEDLVSNKQSGNPTFSLHKEIASPKVIHEFHDSKGSNSLLEEFADELALISYPSDYNDTLARDIESDIREIEFLLYQGEDSDFKDSIDQSDLTNCDYLFVDPTLEMFTDEQPPDYSFPLRFDVDDVLPSLDNEDKVFNSGILSHEKSVKIITRVTQEKKLAVSYASLLSEDFDPPFYELFVFKEVSNSMRLLLFSSENEDKVFKPGIYTSKKFHCCFLSELSHPCFLVFKYEGIWSSSFDLKQALRGANGFCTQVFILSSV